MVSLNRKDGDVCVSKVLLDLLCDCYRVVSDFNFGVVPDVVSRVVSCPDEHVRLDVCFNVR